MSQNNQYFCDKKLIPFINDLNKIKRTIQQGNGNKIENNQICLLEKIIEVFNNPEKLNYIINDNDNIQIALPLLEEDDCSEISIDLSDDEYTEITNIFNSRTILNRETTMKEDDYNDTTDLLEDKDGDLIVEHLTVTSLEKLKYIRDNKSYTIEELDWNEEDESNNEYDIYSCESFSDDDNSSTLSVEMDDELSEDIMSMYT